MKRYISYRRLSRQEVEKNRSGLAPDEAQQLGLAAQEREIARFVEAEGGGLVADYVEVMSGGIDERPKLIEAMAHAKRLRAYLVVSRLDRLSRDSAFVHDLMKRKVKFVVAEFGHDVDPMMLQLYAVFAEKERRVIGQRTKAALAALKARGVKLGNSINLDEAQRLGTATIVAKRRQRDANVLPVIREIENGRKLPLDQIAQALNDRKVPTPRGGAWYPASVARILRRQAG